MNLRQRRRHARVWAILLPLLLAGIALGLAARKASLRYGATDPATQRTSRHGQPGANNAP